MIKSFILSGALFLCAAFSIQAQRMDKKLQNELQSMVSGYHGDIGIYVKNLRTGKTAVINADTILDRKSVV